MFYTYVLLSQKDGNYYTGCTNNLKRRFEEHNNGQVHSTKFRIPFKIIYYVHRTLLEKLVLTKKMLSVEKDI